MQHHYSTVTGPEQQRSIAKVIHLMGPTPAALNSTNEPNAATSATTEKKKSATATKQGATHAA